MEGGGGGGGGGEDDNNNNSNREFIDRFQRLNALDTLIKRKSATHKHP